jgi:hypothetical protein
VVDKPQVKFSGRELARPFTPVGLNRKPFIKAPDRDYTTEPSSTMSFVEKLQLLS